MGSYIYIIAFLLVAMLFVQNAGHSYYVTLKEWKRVLGLKMVERVVLLLLREVLGRRVRGTES
jgi:hypothetical protein